MSPVKPREALKTVLLGCVATVTLAAPTVANAAQPKLEVGVGRADITPVTGVYKGGWACTCATALGQQERLYARVVVLKEGNTKVALVAEDLFAVPAGMIRDAAALDQDIGFSEQNVIDSATHTHSSQSGYMNNSGDNLILPSDGNLDLSHTTGAAADPVMYSFMTRQLALAIRRANADLRPGAEGWGATELLGVTENRSLGAHLADYGVTNAGPNGGTVSEDPGGYADTIDPRVNVLRVDQYRRVKTHGRWVTRRVPVGAFSTFANHGTVDHANFRYYAADHQGTAERVVEAAIRAAGGAAPGQDVVNAFANSDAGDMTAGIDHVGPAAAQWVGNQEAAAMLRAWRAAGRSMSSHPVIALRWTRVCFCGQSTSEGTVDSQAWVGKAAGAGSEEGQTIFYYHGLAHEGDRLPFDRGPQGDKITVLKAPVSQAVPFTVLRVGDGLIATIPGEPTVGVGAQIRAAIDPELAGSPIHHLALVGYAGDYLNYFTTPAEYEQQAYEGGFTMYGEYSAGVLRDALAGLTHDLLTGQPAPAPYDYDPNDGVHVTSAGYGNGAQAATPTAQPQGAVRLGHTSLEWSSGTAGANGIDRPVDRAFVTIQRRSRKGWTTVTNDLGVQIEWSSDKDGNYTAAWEVPLDAAPGGYRFVVTAKQYRLSSSPFTVAAGAILQPQVTGGRVKLGYPQAFLLNDWTYRPVGAAGGAVTFVADGHKKLVRERGSTGFPIPRGTSVVIPARGARDRYGNTNAQPLDVR
jgi:neutral ceramidase